MQQNQKIIIRECRTDELRQITDVTQEAYSVPKNETGIVTSSDKFTKLLESFQQNKIKILVAILNKKIIGAIRYNFPDYDILYFSKLAVRKEHRNRGVGAQLVQRIESIAKEKRCKKILLDCALEKGLVPYYEKLGYKVDEIKKHQDHHDVDMSKELD